MGKMVRGRAGRMNKRTEILEEYSTVLAQMLQSQLRPAPTDRVLHLGSPGATLVAAALAPALGTGEVVVYVYTYDELEDTRAALAGLGNIHVINDLDDLDEDEPPFDIVSCIAPYQLGRDKVIQMIEDGIARLAATGTLYLAGDKHHEFDRYVEALDVLTRDAHEVATKGQYRVVVAQGRNIRKSGRIVRRG